MNAFRDFFNKRDEWGWPRWVHGILVATGIAVAATMSPFLTGELGWSVSASILTIAACATLLGWGVIRLLRRFRGPPSDDGI